MKFMIPHPDRVDLKLPLTDGQSRPANDSVLAGVICSRSLGRCWTPTTSAASTLSHSTATSAFGSRSSYTKSLKQGPNRSVNVSSWNLCRPQLFHLCLNFGELLSSQHITKRSARRDLCVGSSTP